MAEIIVTLKSLARKDRYYVLKIYNVLKKSSLA